MSEPTIEGFELLEKHPVIKGRISNAIRGCIDLTNATWNRITPRVVEQPDHKLFYLVVHGFHQKISISDLIQIADATTAFQLTFVPESNEFVFMYADKRPSTRLRASKLVDSRPYYAVAKKMSTLCGNSLIGNPQPEDTRTAHRIATRLLSTYGCDFGTKVVYESVQDTRDHHKLTLRYINIKTPINLTALKDEEFALHGSCVAGEGALEFVVISERSKKRTRKEDLDFHDAETESDSEGGAVPPSKQVKVSEQTE
jgi:hypothetical protein